MSHHVSELLRDRGVPVSRSIQNNSKYTTIDFAEVHDLSEFFESSLSTPLSDLYTVSSEYALFLRTSVDLNVSASLPATGFNFDSANLNIDVVGKDISVLDQLSGQLVLAQENTVVEGRKIPIDLVMGCLHG